MVMTGPMLQEKQKFKDQFNIPEKERLYGEHQENVFLEYMTVTIATKRLSV